MKSTIACVLLSSLVASAYGSIFQPEIPKGMNRRLEDDYSWMNGYTIMYENCFHADNVVTFRLCPRDERCEAGCSGGGEYLVDLNFFIDAFSEAQMGAHEYRCEMARENCEYDDDAVCYDAAGLQDCDDQNEDENGFNIQEWMECNALDDDIYIGPYCSEDNYNIYLGVFSDEDCSVAAESDTFYDTYGYTLPYSDTGIVANECADCREHAAEQDQNGGDDADDEDDVIEQCEELYGGSGKCEDELDVDYPDTSSCTYISQLQSDEAVSAGNPKSSSSSNTGRTIFLGIFIAVLVGAACCAGCYMYSRKKKSSEEPMLDANYERDMD